MNTVLRKMMLELNHTIKLTDVQEQFNNSLLSLNREVLPGLKNMEDVAKLDNLKISDLPEISIFNRNSEIKAKDLKGLIKGIISAINGMEKQSNDINGLIPEVLTDVISKDVLTVKQATLLNVINNYNTVSLYTLDLLLYLITITDVKVNGSENEMVKPKIAEIKLNMSAYGEILAFFNKNKNIAKDIVKLSNDKVLIDSKDKGTLNILNINHFKMNITGFIGNPIYHVRMWLVDLEMDRYEVLTEKKKLLELKVLDLKAKKDGEVNPKLTKAIDHYENKLSAVEAEMRKVEEK